MPLSALRMTLAARLLGLLSIMSACAADPKPPSPSPDSPPYTITLTQGNKVVISEESLTVELLAVKDSRCPSDVQCVWEGHAAVTVQVGKPGSQHEILVIGTRARPGMNLPYEAIYGSYRFSLLGLEPANSAAAPAKIKSMVSLEPQILRTIDDGWTKYMTDEN